MKRAIHGFMATALLAIGLSGTAMADHIPVTADNENSGVFAEILSQACWGCWIEVGVADSLGDETGNLKVGDFWEFDFFEIFVGGLGVVDHAVIEATLAFLDPLGAVSSTGNGGFGSFFGLVSGGWLTWNDPAIIHLGDGSWLEIDFEDLHIGGLGNHTTVSARVSRHAAVAVPEPGTLGLLGLALLAMALMHRRRIAAHAA